MTFWLTQVLTGHGCFGVYLCRIGRERITECYHCLADRDDVQHTLAECSAWDAQRRDLTGIIGDLSLPVIISKMIGSEEAWQAVASFCEAVMIQKEANA